MKEIVFRVVQETCNEPAQTAETHLNFVQHFPHPGIPLAGEEIVVGLAEDSKKGMRLYILGNGFRAIVPGKFLETI